MLTILFDGIAYGMLLFVLAFGLAVTLGLMNFINLAHGAFAMAGGYVTVLLMHRCGVPFLACLPLAFVGAALLGARARAHALPAACTAAAAPRPGAVLDRPGVHGGGGGRLLRRLAASRSSSCPAWLQGRRRGAAASASGIYRLFIIAVCGALTRRRCSSSLARTRFGSRLRAAVDDPRVARGPRHQCRTSSSPSTFAVGSGLAGLGGALGAEVLGLDPTFPLKFMIYFLIVVAVGGTVAITGPLLAALLLGIADVAGKYYVPEARRLHRLRADDRRPGLAPAGPVRASARR